MTIRIEKMMGNLKTIDGEENNRKRRWLKDSDRLSRERKKLDQVR